MAQEEVHEAETAVTRARPISSETEEYSGEAVPQDPPWVYALGRIDARFPSIAIEKEFAQATGRADTGGLTDRQALHAVLMQPQNRYLARQLCWVFTIEGLDTYILQPRDSVDLALLVEALRPMPSPMDIDIVVGVMGPIAPPQFCNGLMVPVVIFDQVYSFERNALLQAIPRPAEVSEEDFNPVAHEIFGRIMHMTDNAGATDEHRALNYLAVRYPGVYAVTVDAHRRSCALASVEVIPSRLSSTRKIVEIVFSFTHRQTDVAEKYFCRCDVTEEFPFLVSKMAPYYSH
jgi:hypothetical protein